MFSTLFWQALSNFWRLFLAHFFVESNSSISQLFKTLYFCLKIKALECQTNSTLFHQNSCFFNHPNDFLGNNSNNPMGTRDFYAFFENLWHSSLPSRLLLKNQSETYYMILTVELIKREIFIEIQKSYNILC